VTRKTIEGFPMFLDPADGGISRTLINKGLREPCFMWLLRREAQGSCGLDVGGNIGYTTLSICNTMSSVTVFEPDSRSRKLLIRNIDENGFQARTEVREEAVSDREGPINIYLDAQPNLSSTVPRKKAKVVEISAVTLDSLGVEPEFIKMDIEGAEVSALRGGMGCLDATSRCRILIEVHPQFYGPDNDFKAVISDLLGFGYRFKFVVSAGVPRPGLFKQAGYEAFPGAPVSRRAVYAEVSEDHALDWCSRQIKQPCGKGRVSKKIVRAILLEKGTWQ